MTYSKRSGWWWRRIESCFPQAALILRFKAAPGLEYSSAAFLEATVMMGKCSLSGAFRKFQK